MHMPFYLTPEDANVVIYGHTHTFSANMQGTTLFLNPGEICGRDTQKHEAVILKYTKDKWIVEHYYFTRTNTKLNTKVYEFSIAKAMVENL